MKLPTAILLFARSAVAESRFKRFSPDPRRNQQALAVLNERALRVTRATGFPVFHVTEREQRGANFGDRISHAVADIFARGYERLIIVGGDCPTLSVAQLQRAEALLRGGDPVIGPDRRGGAYLIGLHRREFDFGAFRSLPWQTAGLLHALRIHLAKAATLAIQRDFNSRTDLLKSATPKRGNRVIALLVQLLFQPNQQTFERPVFLPLSPALRGRSDRGPPRPALLRA